MTEGECQYLDIPLRALLERQKGIKGNDRICFWYVLALMESSTADRNSFLCTNKGVRSTCEVAKRFDEAVHGKK